MSDEGLSVAEEPSDGAVGAQGGGPDDAACAFRNNGTGMYAGILGDSRDDGAGVVQDFYRSNHWPYPTDSEAFYLHPTPTTIH